MTHALVYQQAAGVYCESPSGTMEAPPFRANHYVSSCPTNAEPTSVMGYPTLRPGLAPGPRAAYIADWYPQGQALHKHSGPTDGADGAGFTGFAVPAVDDLSPTSYDRSSLLDHWGADIIRASALLHGDPWAPGGAYAVADPSAPPDPNLPVDPHPGRRPGDCFAWVEWSPHLAALTLSGTPIAGRPPIGIYPPDVLASASALVHSWHAGTVQTAPGADWYVFVPPCVWEQGGDVPSRPITYQTTVAAPDDPVWGRHQWWTYTVTLDPGRVTLTWPDGAATHVYSGPPGSDPVRTCAATGHVFKQVSDGVTVHVTHQVVVTGTVDWWDGVTTHTEALPEQTLATIVDQDLTRRVLQVEPVISAA